MKTIYEIVQELEATNSPKIKEQILNENSENELLKKYLIKCLEPTITYGITLGRIPEVTDHQGVKTLSEVMVMLYSLENRIETGNKAITFCEVMLKSLTAEDADVFKRIIDRNPADGVGVKLVNKVWKKLVAEVPYMRCSTLNDKSIAKINFNSVYGDVKGAICELKLDGEFGKLNTFTDTQICSRNGKPYSFLDIFDDIGELYQNVSFDGEFVMKNRTTNKFYPREVSNGKMSKLKDQVKKALEVDSELTYVSATPELQSLLDEVVYVAWDVISKDEYDVGLSTKPRLQRLYEVNDIISNVASKHIEAVEYKIVNSLEEAQEYFEELIARKEEGLVLKNILAKWKKGTSAEQIKFKEKKVVEVEVVGWYHGHEGSKNEKYLGGLTVKTSDGILQCNVGTGFSELDRGYTNYDITTGERDDVYTKYMDDDYIIGKIISLEYNYVSAKPNNDGFYTFFLPTFLEIRDDIAFADTFEYCKTAKAMSTSKRGELKKGK